MKTSKIIKGFTLIGLLLIFCSVAFAQSTTTDGVATDPSAPVNNSNTVHDEAVLYVPANSPVKTDEQGAGAPTPTVPRTILPSYETANITTMTTATGSVIFKIPSDLDAEPAFIDTGHPDEDHDAYIQKLNEYYGGQESYDGQ